ncbi:MAG: FAD-dependent hydroxylase [Phormidium sp. BM_Day4_Bin.17]|nr:FAD-dependent hydroxylase [Phormidium sp. BM_Day4_Bin.17]UCJ10877.1 MAG: FAD-dependent hydroxylase [Phormidium sp. PBR-2020]
MIRCHYDVAIVGGGVVGSALACALRDSGLQVILLDAQSREAALSRQQVYAVTLLTGRILEGIGVWQEILPRINTFRQIRLSDGDRTADVRFLPQDLDLDRLGYVAEHTPLLQGLREFIDKSDNVCCVESAQVETIDYGTDEAIVTYGHEGKTQQLQARLVVAADGGRSPLREAAGISTRGWKYWQSCVTFKVKPEKSHDDIAYEKFQASGPFAILPLPGNRCNVVWTAPHGEAKALMELDEAAFRERLQQRFGSEMGRVELASPRYLFPVQLMQSDRYVKPRLALVGDAAHRCHPVGGQGMNLGIRDVAALAEVLQSAQQRGQDIGTLTVLKRYERWRKLENLTILGFTDVLDRLFSNDWWPLVLLRQLGLWGLRHLPPVKTTALRLMTGLLGRQPQLAQD